MSDIIKELRLPPYYNIFWLIGELRPGSVRDSLWRAAALTESLTRVGVIDKRKRILLVASGISGMVATMHAWRRGPTIMVTMMACRLIIDMHF